MSSSIGNWADLANEQEELLAKVEGLEVSNTQTNLTGGHQGSGDAGSTVSSEEGVLDTLDPAEQSLLQKIIRTALVDTSAHLEIKQKDPTSPLYSATSFEDLNLKPALLKGVYAMGFNAPSRIQEAALPILLSDPPQNLIAQSQSGTGKTAAFVLAMLSRVDPTKHYAQALCLAPTYELALQVGDTIKAMGKYCPEINVIYAVRGEMLDQGTKIKEHIIIGTPGKITDWAFRHKFFDLSQISVFVLDEADVMIATQGYHDQSLKIHRKLSPTCQLMLFSATYNPEVMEFAQKIVPDATIMRLRKEEESLDNIKQYWVACPTNESKYESIAAIYAAITIGQAMIFCQTRDNARKLATQLTTDGHAVALLSGELTVDQRIAVLNRFRDSIERILITTNVMARGIDIEKVSLVVNYDIPLDVNRKPDCETYLHRIGRTGRFGKQGLAINLVQGEPSFKALKEIERHFGRPIKKLDPDDISQLEELEK